MVAGKCSKGGGCLNGICYRTCDDIGGGSICFTTQLQEYSETYAKCSEDAHCRTCFNCATLCTSGGVFADAGKVAVDVGKVVSDVGKTVTNVGGAVGGRRGLVGGVVGAAGDTVNKVGGVVSGLSGGANAQVGAQAGGEANFAVATD